MVAATTALTKILMRPLIPDSCKYTEEKALRRHRLSLGGGCAALRFPMPFVRKTLRNAGPRRRNARVPRLRRSRAGEAAADVRPQHGRAPGRGRETVAPAADRQAQGRDHRGRGVPAEAR